MKKFSFRFVPTTTALILAGGFVLTACTPQQGEVATNSATPTPGSAVPANEPIVFSQDGTANDNLPIFKQTVEKVWASEGRAAGRSYIDALVAVGFSKENMEVTSDFTGIGMDVESTQFAIQWKGECLLGQVGPATGDPVVSIQPLLGTGKCLLGETRTIDW